MINPADCVDWVVSIIKRRNARGPMSTGIAIRAGGVAAFRHGRNGINRLIPHSSETYHDIPLVYRYIQSEKIILRYYIMKK
jgi:hypothetical protein